MVLVVSTPFAAETQEIATWQGIPDLAFRKDELVAHFDGPRVARGDRRDEHRVSPRARLLRRAFRRRSGGRHERGRARGRRRMEGRRAIRPAHGAADAQPLARGVADPALPPRRRGLPGSVVALREPRELPRAARRARRPRRAAARRARRRTSRAGGRGARRSSRSTTATRTSHDRGAARPARARHPGHALRRDGRRSAAARSSGGTSSSVHPRAGGAAADARDRPRRNELRLGFRGRRRPSRALPRAPSPHRTARGRGADGSARRRSRSGPASRPAAGRRTGRSTRATLAAVARDPRIRSAPTP